MRFLVGRMAVAGLLQERSAEISSGLGPSIAKFRESFAKGIQIHLGPRDGSRRVGHADNPPMGAMNSRRPMPASKRGGMELAQSAMLEGA
jgi:hypothetical protein